MTHFVTGNSLTINIDVCVCKVVSVLVGDVALYDLSILSCNIREHQVCDACYASGIRWQLCQYTAVNSLLQ
jgi:hypothetical protein